MILVGVSLRCGGGGPLQARELLGGCVARVWCRRVIEGAEVMGDVVAIGQVPIPKERSVVVQVDAATNCVVAETIPASTQVGNRGIASDRVVRVVDIRGGDAFGDRGAVE